MNVDTLLTALAGIAGVFVGAGVQYWAGKSLEQRKHFQELRSRAYVDFLTAVATIAQSRGTHAGARTALTDAKVRITVYGTAAVVQALASFAATYQYSDRRPRIEHSLSSFKRCARILLRETSTNSRFVRFF
jgi:hypothetical protein